MHAVASYPAPVIAAIEGHCMGGGLDLALACHRRIAATSAVFGHRGAALGLITGWGGTQRLPRLIGKGRALELFIAAEKLDAQAGGIFKSRFEHQEFFVNHENTTSRTTANNSWWRCPPPKRHRVTTLRSKSMWC